MTRSLLAELSRRGSIRNAELEFMTKDGKEVPVLLSATAVKDAEGNTTSYIAVIRDITDRKELENSLRRSEAQALAAIDAAHAFTFSYEIAAGKITWGGGVEEITGYTAEEFGEVDMRQWTKRIHPEDRDGVLAVFEGAPMEERATAEFRFKARKGYITLAFTSTTEMVDGKPVRVVGILQDMTEQKEMQDRLVRSERLAILGQMAGGVGHELRNPLGAIKSAVYLLKMIFEEPEPDVKESLEILEKEVDTSERIISSLLDFARPRPAAKRKVDLNDVVRDALTRARVPDNIKVETYLHEGLSPLLADPDQLGQVFGNVILNGVQAMPDGGRLLVRTETPRPGWAAVAVSDSGEGIPGDRIGKVFEPLFTTKAKGIGLGLAVTKSLIEGHEGTIEVESEAGKGSTFTVVLPLITKESDENGRES
jgi:PAS domain S-box-containing protein